MIPRHAEGDRDGKAARKGCVTREVRTAVSWSESGTGEGVEHRPQSYPAGRAGELGCAFTNPWQRGGRAGEGAGLVLGHSL